MMIWRQIRPSKLLRFVLAAVSSVLFLVLFSGAAAADKHFEDIRCLGSKAALDVRISDCTLVINSENTSKWLISLATLSRGNVYHQKGQFDRAIQDYDQAIKAYPGFALAFRNRGATYAKLKKFSLAIRDLNKAIELNPSDAGAFNNRGTTYIEMGEHAKAIQDIIHAIKLDPDNFVYHFNLGKFYADAGEYDLAFKSYGRAISINPKHAPSYANLAWVLSTAPDANIRNGDVAVRMATKAITLNRSTKNQFILSVAYGEARRFEDAVRELQHAIDGLAAGEGNGDLEKYRNTLNLFKNNKPYLPVQKDSKIKQ